MLLVMLVLAATPPKDLSARYIMRIGGTPAGIVGFSLKGDQFTYTADQFFDSTFTRVLTVSDSRAMPEVLWLSTLREVGCREVLEERTNSVETVCIDAVKNNKVSGRIAGTHFDAVYGSDSQLQVLTLPSVEFRQSLEAVTPSKNLFPDGFSLQPGKKIALVPAVKGVEVVTVVPGDSEQPLANCLNAAREYLGTHAAATVVTGLVLEDGKAWPHAWVKLNGRQIDPSVPRGGDVSARRYVSFPQAQAGQLFLELAAGTRAVTAPN